MAFNRHSGGRNSFSSPSSSSLCASAMNTLLGANPQRRIWISMIVCIAIVMYVNVHFSINQRSTALRADSAAKTSTDGGGTDGNSKKFIFELDKIREDEKERDKAAAARKNVDSAGLEAIKSRRIAHILFTSTCSFLDNFQALVLSHTVRKTGFNCDVTRLVHSCPTKATLPDPNGMKEVFSTRVIDATLSSTSLEPDLVADWLQSEAAKDVDDEDYVIIVESDSIFTKEVDLALLVAETSGTVHDGLPMGFAQDAGWYQVRQPILPRDELSRVVKDTSSAIFSHTSWRPFAVEAPFVFPKRTLAKMIGSMQEFGGKLNRDQLHFALPLALAHHKLTPGISGALRVETYDSRSQNWDFADDVKENPCNSSLKKDRMVLDSFPMSIRPLNFTLPTWKDGSEWSFSYRFIPQDILSCDGWVLNEPSGELWALASHTRGNEGVSTILRSRFSYSICTSVKAVNSAILQYKKAHCGTGFNENKRLMFSSTDTNRKSAIPFSKQPSSGKTPNKEGDLVFGHFGEFSMRSDTDHVEADGDSQRNGELKTTPEQASSDLHFVFTTSCSPYQDWQAETLLASAARVHQQGRFTRILSGCSNSELAALVQRGSVHTNLFFHATPDFKDSPYPDVEDSNYTPYNKPFGLRHWLIHANPPVWESVVVVLDPDFYFLRTFSVNNTVSQPLVYTGTLRDTAKDLVTDAVKPGTILAQNWVHYLDAGAWSGLFDADLKTQCGAKCKISQEQARELYAVGPPYAMAKSDLATFVEDYGNITVAVRKSHPDQWLSEMVAYSIATAKHSIRHTRVDNLALTDPRAADSEAWKFVLQLVQEYKNPCSDPVQPMVPPGAPVFLHACKKYAFESTQDPVPWLFYKQLFPEDLYTCDAWLLEVPQAEVWDEALDRHRNNQSNVEDLQNVYGLCTLTRLTNLALTAYKNKFCANGYNSNRKLRLMSPRPAKALRGGENNELWIELYEKAKAAAKNT